MADETSRRILWQVTDPRGLIVILTHDVWASHVAYRPELVSHARQVRLAVQDPDAIYFDPDSTATKSPGTVVYWYYKSGVLAEKYQGNWVAVVVKVVSLDENQQGYVETAMLPSRVLKRLVLEWKKSE